jgi:flagellar protein FlaF
MAIAAYAAASPSTRTARSIEYEALARVTRRLRAALSDQGSPFATLVAALHDNRQLWLALASDVAEPGNGLPELLRARLYYLAEFTNVHSGRVLAGQANAQVLIDINAAVMRGLRHEEATA